jgi:hypothetical protein
VGRVKLGGAGMRRRREEGGRPHRVVVRLSDREMALVSARAAAAQRTVPALMADLALAPALAPTLDPGTARALLVELFAIRRGLDKTGTNINGIARYAHGTGEVRPAAAAVMALLPEQLTVLDAFARELVGYFPGLVVGR